MKESTSKYPFLDTYYIIFLFLHRYMSRYRVMTPFILHIKSYVSDYSVIPPHTGLCPLLQCYPHINSYVHYCSIKPPHTGLSPLLQCYPTYIVVSPTAVLNLHIKSYPWKYRVVTYSPHKELCPLLQLFSSDTELFPLL